MGITNAPCKITVAKESGQSAATVVGLNLTKMWSRMYAPSRRNAVWYCSQDTEPQLQGAYLVTGTGAGQLLYSGPTNGEPYGTIFGRPVIPIEQCATLGTEGDVILADLSQVIAVRKAALDRSQSIHLRFDYDETVFKYQLRMDAQAAWQKALTPYKGTNTVSPIVTLATRS